MVLSCQNPSYMSLWGNQWFPSEPPAAPTNSLAVVPHLQTRDRCPHLRREDDESTHTKGWGQGCLARASVRGKLRLTKQEFARRACLFTTAQVHAPPESVWYAWGKASTTSRSATPQNFGTGRRDGHAEMTPVSQVSIHDVAEAYRTIPIKPSQWPGLVVHLQDSDQFAINTILFCPPPQSIWTPLDFTQISYI